MAQVPVKVDVVVNYKHAPIIGATVTVRKTSDNSLFMRALTGPDGVANLIVEEQTDYYLTIYTDLEFSFGKAVRQVYFRAEKANEPAYLYVSIETTADPGAAPLFVTRTLTVAVNKLDSAQPLTGATVRVYDDKAFAKGTVVTQASGQVIFSFLVPAEFGGAYAWAGWAVVVSCPGYQSAQVPLADVGVLSDSLEFVLSPSTVDANGG